MLFLVSVSHPLVLPFRQTKHLYRWNWYYINALICSRHLLTFHSTSATIVIWPDPVILRTLCWTIVQSALIRNYLYSLWLKVLQFVVIFNTFISTIDVHTPIRVASPSKAWTVFARSNTAILGSIPTQDMDVCVCFFFCVCVVLCVGSGLATGSSLVCVKKIEKLKKRPGSIKGL
jgi:hypothetical protein